MQGSISDLRSHDMDIQAVFDLHFKGPASRA